MEFDDADFEVTLLNNIKLFWRWFAAGIIVPFVVGALQNVVWNTFFNAGPLGIITWLSVPGSVGLSTVVTVYIIRKNSMSVHRLVWEFLRLLLPSVLASIIFLVLVGSLTFYVVRSQHVVYSPLKNLVLQFSYALITTVLGIFMVHMARGEMFLSAAKEPFRRLRKEPLWTIFAAVVVLVVMWVVNFPLKFVDSKVSSFFGFLPLFMNGSLWAVVLEYIDTRRIRRWRAKFK